MNKPFPWHESPLAQPMFWAAAFEAKTLNDAFHYRLGEKFNAAYHPARQVLTLTMSIIASDPEVEFSGRYDVTLNIHQYLLSVKGDDDAALAMDMLLSPALPMRDIEADRQAHLEQVAREHADIEAHNRELDAWLRGGG
jgi:hypothetical protein